MIYADNAATTRISDKAFEKMLPFLQEQYGNASSQYSLGAKAKHAIESSRKQVAIALGAEPSEITFTSGGSEANSWVLRCVAETYHNEPMHVITSAIEHHSVLNACHALEQAGVQVTYLPVNPAGQVLVSNVEAAIQPNTKLVSIMFANNEIGTIQPIATIGALLRGRGILFHTDAVQAVGHIPVDVAALNVDFLTASAHKFNGAKGTGVLYKRLGLELSPLVFGGEQEHGKRAGTENVAGIVGLGYAIEESIANMSTEQEKQISLVRATVDGLRAAIPDIKVNAENVGRLSGTLSATFPHASKGICVSTNSACNSGKDEPSHVLLALGLSEEQAKSSIRISYGRYNTLQETNEIIIAIRNAYDKITGASINQRSEFNADA